MAVTFNSLGVGVKALTASTSQSWQHVIGGSATALLVAIQFDGAFHAPTVTRTVRIGTRTMTSLGQATIRSEIRIPFTDLGGTVGWVEIFGLINPPTGVQLISVSTSQKEKMLSASVAYNGVSQIGTLVQSSALLNTKVSVAVTPQDKGMAAAFFCTGNVVTMTVGAGVTLRWSDSATFGSLGIEDVVGTGTTKIMEITGNKLAQWDALAVPLVPATILPISHIAAANPLYPRATLTATATRTVNHRVSATPLVVTATRTASATALTPAPAKTGDANLTALVFRTATISGGTARQDASLAIQATTVAGVLVVPRVAGALAVTATPRATVGTTPGPPSATKSALRYVGRDPDTGSSVVHRLFVSSFNRDNTLTVQAINEALIGRTQYLATTAYVDQGDAARASKAQVQENDQKYFPITGHGLATTDSAGTLPSSMLPSGFTAERTTRSYAFTGAAISPTRVTTSVPTELLIASITVPDQGYPWIPLVFAYVKGYDRASTAGAPWQGVGPTDSTGQILTNNIGLLSVLGGNDITYAVGKCTASIRDTYSAVLPITTGTVAPDPINGSLTFKLYGCCRGGSGRTGEGYTFTGDDLVFYVLAMPAAGA